MTIASHPAPARVAIVLAATASLLAPASCSSAPRAAAPAADRGVRLELVASGFERPVHAVAPPGDARLFVVEQGGRILIVDHGEVRPRPFLDLSDHVTRRGNEQGLLGLAFHPRYAANGRFYVNYTDRNGDTRIVRYTVSDDPDVADPASASLVLTVRQPFANHNGGLVMFGPDRMLWIGMGDGGSGGDPHGNGQSLGTLLGKMLRIDVDRGEPYAIPPNNPFVGRTGARPEIWAYGLRNPWRFAFDDSMLYIADVGQDHWEEVDVVPLARPGPNLGWNVMEGTHCFKNPLCNRRGLVLPVLDYGHDQGCSVTGGIVYHGRAVPALAGHYLFADFCTGWIESFAWRGGRIADRRRWPAPHGLSPSSFGEDGAGEALVVSLDGAVYRFVQDR